MTDLISHAYTIEQLKARVDADNYVTANIVVDFTTIIAVNNGGFENFLDFLSIELTGIDTLMNTSYKLVGSIDGNLILQVSGDVSGILENYEE